MGFLDPASPEFNVSRRYSAAQGWVRSKADPEAGVNPLQEAVMEDGQRFTDLLETAHRAVSCIGPGAEVHPTPPNAIAWAETAVAALEGACAALGYKRPF